MKIFRAFCLLFAVVCFGFAVLCVILRQYDSYWVLHMLTGLFSGIAMVFNYLTIRWTS